MNTLDRTLESLSRAEPAADHVQEAQRKLEAVIARAPRRKITPRVTGWFAAAASALAAVTALVWLPLAPTQALAFSDVQKHFRDFRTLRFDFEQRMDGTVLVQGRVSLLADGSVRTEVGEDVVVIVNAAERRVLTLLRAGHIALVTPLDATPTRDDSMEWLREVRDFQGLAVAIPGTRTIRGQIAHGWKLSTEHGEIALWASEAGLPLEMQIDQGVKIDMDFRFEFDAALPPELFSTQVPAGYTLRAPDED
jgi:outer membrane lipoprotein-sorting protein